MECNRRAVGGNLDGFGNQRVECERLVPRPDHQAVVDEIEALRRGAFQAEGVERVKVAEDGLMKCATFGCVGVCVVEMGEALWHCG